jgi:hypothetical protein
MRTISANLSKIAQDACKEANLSYTNLLTKSKNDKSSKIFTADTLLKTAENDVTFAIKDYKSVDEMYLYR